VERVRHEIACMTARLKAISADVFAGPILSLEAVDVELSAVK